MFCEYFHILDVFNRSFRMFWLADVICCHFVAFACLLSLYSLLYSYRTYPYLLPSYPSLTSYLPYTSLLPSYLAYPYLYSFLGYPYLSSFILILESNGFRSCALMIMLYFPGLLYIRGTAFNVDVLSVR